jgi:Trk K+ transport system NAD-binding subunit
VQLLLGAGCQEVVQVGELLGRAIARRISGHGGRTHVVGRLDDLLIAEAAATNTSFVGKTVRDLQLRERLDVNVVGLVKRGRYAGSSADSVITEDTVLLLSGTWQALDAYDREVQTDARPEGFAVIIGGGRVGRATSRSLAKNGVPHKVVERITDRVTDWSIYVIGDATDPDILKAAGLDRAASVAITTHDDDVNVYLTLYCRRARPDLQIISRATLEHNVSTLRSAGADFVLSYVPMEANAIFDTLRRGNLMLLAEGLDVFTVRVPPGLAGRTIAEAGLRATTGVNVLAVRREGGQAAPPDIQARLEPGTEMVLIGDRDAERAFFAKYGMS